MVKERLKDEGRGNLIDERGVLLAFFAGGVEDGVRFLGGESFIPHAHGQVGVVGELAGKAADAFRLFAGFTGESKGESNDELGAGMLARKTAERSQVLFGIVFSCDGEQRLRSEAERVRDGDADAPGADIESQIAGGAAMLYRAVFSGGRRVWRSLVHSENEYKRQTSGRGYVAQTLQWERFLTGSVQGRVEEGRLARECVRRLPAEKSSRWRRYGGGAGQEGLGLDCSESGWRWRLSGIS